LKNYQHLEAHHATRWQRHGAGRKAGIPNKINGAVRKRALQGGQLPLDYMLDETGDKSRRDDMARAAAPFIHTRILTAVVFTKVREDEEPLHAGRQGLTDESAA
jgi:hypothetical protein